MGQQIRMSAIGGSPARSRDLPDRPQNAPTPQQSLRIPRMIAGLSLIAYLLITPINDPWFALTARGLAIAALLAFWLTPWRRWVVSICLSGSLLLIAPSFYGEQSGLLGAGLAVVASILSAFSQLTNNVHGKTTALGTSILPILLLCAYWALVSDAQAQIPLVYSLVLIAVAFILRNDFEAVRGCLALVSIFVAVLGYAWLFSTLIFTIGGLAPTKIPSTAYILRPNFSYWTWGPLLITNSSGFYGLRRASDIGGEPGTWALYAALGTTAAAVIFVGRPLLRRFLVVGGLLAFISSQSAGAFMAILLAAVATFGWLAISKRSMGPATHRVPMAFLAILLATGFPFLLSTLVTLKAAQNIDSLIDRGFGFLSGAQTSVIESRISLVSAYAVDGAIAILPMVGLAVCAVVLRKNPYTFAFAAFFAVMGLLVQPVQWHIALWFACFLLAVVNSQVTTTDRAEPQERTERLGTSLTVTRGRSAE